MQHCLILGNQRRVKRRKIEKTGRSWEHMMREAGGFLCGR